MSADCQNQTTELPAGDDVLLSLCESDRPADWQSVRLGSDAVSVADALPPIRQEVLGWLSDPRVSIYFMPAIVRRTPTSKGYPDEWWSGLPGSYLDLRQLGWKLTHWRPL